MKPKFKHDCDECVFVGAIGRYDLYVHDWHYPDYGFYRNYIARYGDEGENYESGSVEFLHYLVIKAVDECMTQLTTQ